MVFTIEPGLYDAEIGGFRHSDTVVVTEEGYDVLTDYPSDIESLTIPPSDGIGSPHHCVHAPLSGASPEAGEPVVGPPASLQPRRWRTNRVDSDAAYDVPR